MLIVFVLVWFYIFLLKYLLQSTNIIKSMTIYPFYLSYETNYLVKRLEDFTQLPRINKCIPTILNIGAVFMILVLIASPFLFIYLLSHVHFSSSYLVVNEEHKDSISSLIVPLVPYLNIPQSYLLSFWTSTIISALFHELGHGVAAVYETVTVEKVGLFIVLLFPGAYVNLEATVHKLEIWPKLKIYSGGIAFNLMLALICFLMLNILPILLIFAYKRSSGVVITSIMPTSNLNKELHPGNSITAINGIKVGSNGEYKRLLIDLDTQALNRKMSYRSRQELITRYDPEHAEYFYRPINNNSAKVMTIGIGTGYCVQYNPLLFNQENRNNDKINNHVRCCLDLFRGETTETEGGLLLDCFLHTKTWATDNYELICGKVREIYDPVITDFSRHCNIDSECPVDGQICIKMLSPLGSQLTVINTSSKKNVKRVLFFVGPPLQLVEHTAISSYRLRNWIYSYLYIDSIPWLHNTVLAFRGNIVMYLKLLIQVNLSSALLNSLPVLHLDGGQILPSLLKLIIPRGWQLVSNIIVCLSSFVIVLVSIIGLWPLIIDATKDQHVVV